MPMEFLTDAQGAGYGRFDGVPSRADLERFFFLDDADKDLLGDRRGDHNRLGLMLQATTVRKQVKRPTRQLASPRSALALSAARIILDPELLAGGAPTVRLAAAAAVGHHRPAHHPRPALRTWFGHHPHPPIR
jgi:hypothetical protein